MHRTAGRRPLPPIFVLALAIAAPLGCGGPQRAGSSGTTAAPGAVGSGRQSPAEPPAAPSLEIGLQLFRKGDFKGAEPHLAGALRQSPRDRRILEALGAIYERTDRYRLAEESLRAALAIEPASPGARLGLAAVLIDTGRYDEARSELDRARGLEPGNVRALVKSALLEARRGKAEVAEALAREAVGRRPEDAEAHYVLGLSLEQRGRLDQAAAEMRRARDLGPDHLGALSHLATIEMRLGRREEAERLLRAHGEALRRRRVEERVRGNRLRGVEAFNRRDYPAALQEFQAIAREDPNDAQVHLHLGSTYLEMGRLDEARQALERCLAFEPRNERALAELGRLEALANRLDDAVATLQKAIAANPEFPEPHYYLAGIFRARGDDARYRSEMQRYQDLRSRSRGSASDLIPDDRDADR